MNASKLKKLIILNVPYLFIGLFASKLPQAWRLAEGADISAKMLNISDGFSEAFASILPSFHPQDLVIGLLIGGIIRLVVYMKGKNAKQYRKGAEYGSARWGNAKDIEPYKDPVFKNNVILTQTEHLSMNNRPKDPKTSRNKNVLIIGGSGSGKTRFWLKPNLMQCHSSYVVTDPKGDIVIQTGKMLLREGYRLKILNTINFKKSMKYNPFAYLKSEKDILKLVTALIANTKGDGKSGDDFWVKAETLLYTALIGYIWYEAPVEEQNFNTLIEFIKELQRVDRAAMQDLDAKDVKLQFPCFKPLGTTVLVLKSPKTQSSVRRVYIPSTVAKMLLTLKQEQDELKELLGDEYKAYNLVVCSSDGRPIEGQIINRAFNKLIKDNNFPKVVFHSLRHTSVTYKLKLNGGDIKAVQGDTGHSQINMVTDVYSHIIDEDRCKNAQKLESAFYSKDDAPKETQAATDDKDTQLLELISRSPELAELLFKTLSAKND